MHSSLESINTLVSDAINATDHFEDVKKRQLIETLTMSEADYSRLAPKMGKIIYILKMLNIRSILQTDTGFLGLLYEAFIRYEYDNNSLGIVFTPRHITKFCAELIDVTAKDKVIDIACGSGGFLVASFDRMLLTYKEMGIPHSVIRESLYGFDTNPTVWALATLRTRAEIIHTLCLPESAIAALSSVDVSRHASLLRLALTNSYFAFCTNYFCTVP